MIPLFYILVPFLKQYAEHVLELIVLNRFEQHEQKIRYKTRKVS